MQINHNVKLLQLFEHKLCMHVSVIFLQSIPVHIVHGHIGWRNRKHFAICIHCASEKYNFTR